jgi:hypothetical protein
MAKNPIQEIVDLPLTGIRFSLSDKLLRANSMDRFQPIHEGQIEQLANHMDAAEININQLFNFKIKAEEVREKMLAGKAIGDLLWELIQSLRIIQAEKDIPLSLVAHLEETIRDWQGCSFSAAELKFVLQQVRDLSGERRLDAEIHNAYQAIFTGKAPDDINLSSPARQLIWATHLLFLIYNPWLMQAWPEDRRQGSFSLDKTKLWKQLLDSHHIRYIRVLFASHIYNLLRNDKIMVGWGAPGSWFSFSVNPAPGRINCDLLYAMLLGFDHARACIVHEIGHAVQTKGIPHYIQELNDAALEMEGDPEGDSLAEELKLKQYFLNASEDNCINRYTTEIGGVFGQNYGYSLNYFYTAIGDIGRRYVRRQPFYDESSPQNRFKNLTFIISRAFLTHNGLFENSTEDWEMVMARPEWIKGRDRRDPEKKLEQEHSFKQLMEMCEEIEHYFPPLQEMAGGPEYYSDLAGTYAEKRFELIHEMWELYAQDIVDEIIERDGGDVDDSMDQFQMKMNHQEPPPKKKEKKEEKEKSEEDNKDDAEEEKKDENPAPPTQSDNDSDKSSDEDLEGDQPDQEKPPEDDDDSEGESGEDASSGDGGTDDEPDDTDESSDEGDPEDGEDEAESASEPDDGGKGASDQPKPPPEKKEKDDKDIPEDAEKEEVEMEGEPPEGAETKEENDKSQPPDEDNPDQPQDEEPPTELSAEELEEMMQKLMDQLNDVVEYKENEESDIRAEEDDEAEAELVKEEEDETLEPEVKPEEDNQDQQSGERGDKQGGLPDSKGVLDRAHLPDDPMASIGDLMEALRETEKLEQNKPERRKPERTEEEPPPRPKLDIPPPMSLDQLATGDWQDFSRRVSLHGPVIALMAKALERLKDAQLKLIHKISKKHSIIPQGGDLRRFDHGAMHRLIQQIAKNEAFNKDDLAMFRKDDRRAAPTRPTRIILIDGSRSMTFGSVPYPMDKAIQEAVIDYMASRIAGYDTYICMFGPLNPISLAQPGDSLVEIGKRIEKVHGGLNTMTYLAPALMQTIELVANRKKFTEPYMGFTNFVIYSDGDIDDLRNSREVIQQIFLHAPKSTFDIVLITNKHATPMDVLIRTLDVTSPIHEVGLVRSNAQRRFPLALTSTYKLTTRIRAAKSGFADPSWFRGAQFKRLLQHLTR